MNVNSHIINNKKIAEVGEDGVFIKRAEDALDLLGDLYYQGFDGIIIREQNITPDFFDLKTGMAGEILQKFSNYRVRLAIIGDFSSYKAKSICDFIYESNKTGHINFLSSMEEALKKISNTTP
ncbi:uncharacterized protein DUF4180 [Arcticibacter tournemirensis]|uniref:DUF4180 domain-containing protein n=1 Tax=Arcticibacter tournemirensis TaxID=699437 RepID=A0A4Q0MC98_9SPHI|nr:DUF4180 domain-containing protein [Arcticibacter tournemirensis]KAA8478240.1 DUF4180 domain-containing protein [Arcticibacter tournemirensis]RXF70509.1 DUF4180 domain-containing protein [Arcticibacter tournemirensis]TQM50732.1 uncharacterized protein DUF4180 [Arcticibacter tournemirensis]